MATEILKLKKDFKLKRRHYRAARYPFNWFYHILMLLGVVACYPFYLWVKLLSVPSINVAKTPDFFTKLTALTPLIFTFMFLMVYLIGIWGIRAYHRDAKLMYKSWDKLRLYSYGFTHFYRLAPLGGPINTHAEIKIAYQDIKALTVFTNSKTGLSFLRVDGKIIVTLYQIHYRGLAANDEECLEGAEGFRYFPLYYHNTNEFLNELSRRSGVGILRQQTDAHSFTERRIKEKLFKKKKDKG